MKNKKNKYKGKFLLEGIIAISIISIIIIYQIPFIKQNYIMLKEIENRYYMKSIAESSITYINSGNYNKIFENIDNNVFDIKISKLKETNKYIDFHIIVYNKRLDNDINVEYFFTKTKE